MLGNISFLDIFDVYRVLLGMVSAELILWSMQPGTGNIL